MKSGIWGAGLGLALLAIGSSAQAAGDPAAGEKVFARCAACHKVGSDAKAGFGPVLNGVVGAKAASSPGYAYSPAMKAAKLVWTPATLDKYLTGPAKMVPGTKMAFPGVPDAKDRANVIAYLGRFNAKGQKK
ncbi:MAG: cytochrome c family protein [Sphingomonadales bacterium]|nr:cytochrome c family protein [Sphingomonadales bacterium]MDE2171823.1 cytochrome c family protein [Sphingomonadales bacterium]